MYTNNIMPPRKPKSKVKRKSAPSRIKYNPRTHALGRRRTVRNIEMRGSRAVSALLSRYPRGMRLTQLPPNIQHHIMGRLTLRDLSALSRTSGQVRRTVRNTVRGAVARPRPGSAPPVYWGD